MDLNSAIAVDTETTGLSAWHGDMPFAVSMCNESGETWYCQWDVDPFTREVYPDDEELDFVAQVISDKNIPKVMHNAKFDVRMLDRAYDIPLRGELHETMFAAHVVNALEHTFALKPLSDKYLGINDQDQKDLLKQVNSCRIKAKKLGWSIHESNRADYWLPRQMGREPDNLCEKYAVQDAERTMLLWLMYKGALTELDNWDAYYREMALWPVNYQMESRGVYLDTEKNAKEIREHSNRSAHELTQLQMMLGWDRPFEPTKDADVIAALRFLKIRIKQFTATGRVAVGFDALEEYLEVPFVQHLIKYRSAQKALSFFTNYQKKSVKEQFGDQVLSIVHPDFVQVGPKTSRFSCRNPNLQNVPNAVTTRSREPIQARGPFGPRPGYFWYCNDYSQLEVRIFAHVSKDETMARAIELGLDMHTECANKAWGGRGNQAAINTAVEALELRQPFPSCDEVEDTWGKLGWDPEKARSLDREAIANKWLSKFDYLITEAEGSLGKKTSRARAKLVLFAKLYGGGPDAIKDLLEVSRDEAADFLADYDVALPGIVRYIKMLSAQARKEGAIRNCYGRYVPIDPEFTYRAVNYMVQGSAAELLKRAMVRCHEFLRSTGLDAHLLMTIHDELVFEIKKEHAKLWLIRRLKEIMEDHEGIFDVHLPTEMSRVRVSWAEKEKMKI